MTDPDNIRTGICGAGGFTKVSIGLMRKAVFVVYQRVD